MSASSDDILHEVLTHWSDTEWFVFSPGGCGTNHLRRLLRIWGGVYGIRRTIHMHAPPTTLPPPLRGAIFIFGDPVASICSIYRRRLWRVANVLAGHNLYEGPDAMDLSRDYTTDLFRYHTHFHNWCHAHVPYPVICINYMRLPAALRHLRQIIPSMIVPDGEAEHVRQTKLGDLDPDLVARLRHIYRNLRVEEMPTIRFRSPGAGLQE